jgi:hypothetical protein
LKKNLHLIISILIVFPVALIYGLNPNGILTNTFHFKIDDINLENIFKGVMGLYISVSIFWLIGIIKPQLWKTATLVNILFMGGLVFGRLISLILDGMPSYIFLIGLCLETFLAIWGIFNLKKYNQ